MDGSFCSSGDTSLTEITFKSKKGNGKLNTDSPLREKREATGTRAAGSGAQVRARLSEGIMD